MATSPFTRSRVFVTTDILMRSSELILEQFKEQKLIPRQEKEDY